MRRRFPFLLYLTRIGFFTCFIFNKTGVRVLELELFSNSRLSFSLAVIVDKIRLRFCFVVTLIAACVFTFAHKYIEEDPFCRRFLWILITFVVRIIILTFSGRMILLLLG